MKSVTGAFDNQYGVVRCSTECHRERCLLLASVGAEMTKRSQGTLLGPFKTVLRADQIEHVAYVIWS
jgi:hypothetical protein